MAINVISTEANKTPVHRAIAHNHGVAGESDEIFAPRSLAHMPSKPPMDRQGLDQFIRHVADGLSDFGYEIHDQIVQEALVVNRIMARGVHTAELLGVPATYRSIKMRIINLFKMKDGRVVEQWAESDLLGLLQQIGSLPPA